MSIRKRRLLLSVAAITLLVIGGILGSLTGSFTHQAQARTLLYDHLNKIQKHLLSGYADYELNPANSINPKTYKNYYPRGDDGCPLRQGDNLKVNQNCSNVSDADLQGRGQAQNETSIAQDPYHPQHIVASYNDYRRGDGNCYASYSLDSGHNWTDTTIPMGFTRGGAFGAAREYWQSGGDTSVAWDTRGNAYLNCQVFNRGKGVSPNPDQSSAVYLFRSTQNLGASWNFPGRPSIEHNDVIGAGNVLEDKPLMTVDNHVGSPFQDRVYVTYTEFAADGTGYIYESYSADYGEHFSPRVLVSTTSTLCNLTFGLPTPNGTCNENQFSQPFTGSDGNLYVVYNNFNNVVTGNDNRNQVLLTKSTDGGNTFGTPVKVADYYDLPDCATYQGQDAGRACVPEKGSSNSFFRATNYASGAVNPRDPQQVVVTFGSYINPHSSEKNGCVPAGFAASGNNLYTGVKTPGACNNDILVSVSTNKGASFTGTTIDPRNLTSTNPNSDATDQYWQWAAFTQNGKLAVSYFDRKYGQDETNGFSDISLSGSDDLVHFGVKRVTSSSMPPPTQFSGVFYGDYTGLTAFDDAHPAWMDTRDPELFLCPNTGTPTPPPTLCVSAAPNASIANDQDIFTASEDVPTK